ncbi:MAG TPA: PD-(D/E)XK nuclease family protein, partial [Bryobacteraceae bacterium]|nr:PD-(D/E)XK nuclease family protein [Bryobacteraceae bacterium]
NWAEDVCQALGFDAAEPRDEILTLETREGEPWRLRLASGVSDAPAVARFAGAAAEPDSRGASAGVLAVPPRPALLGAQGLQQDANATVTALTEFAKCPRAYFLGHYLGFSGSPRSGRAGGMTAAELGSQVHAALAGEAPPDADPEALRLARVFQQSPLGRRAAQAGRAEREFDFFLAVDDLVIRGQVDLWFEEGGELVIVDYKTDDVSRSEAAGRAGDYALQLRLYAMAVERVAGRAPSRACLHFLRPNTVIEVDLAPTLLDAPEQVIRDFQRAQATLEFPLNEGARCRRCPFVRDLCPAPG